MTCPPSYWTAHEQNICIKLKAQINHMRNCMPGIIWSVSPGTYICSYNVKHYKLLYKWSLFVNINSNLIHLLSKEQWKLKAHSFFHLTSFCVHIQGPANPISSFVFSSEIKQWMFRMIHLFIDQKWSVLIGCS